MTRLQQLPPRHLPPLPTKSLDATKEIAAPEIAALPAPPALVTDAMTATRPAQALQPGLRAPEPEPKAIAEHVREKILPICVEIEAGVEPPADAEPAKAAAIAETALQDHAPVVADLLDGFAQIFGLATKEKHRPRAEHFVDRATEALLAGAPTTPPAAAAPAPPPDPALVQHVQELMTPPLKKLGSTAPQAFEAIEIPAPQLVKLEALATKALAGGFDFATMDVETAVAIVMFQLGRDAEADLRELLQDMDASRRKKDAMRKDLTAAKELQSSVQTALRNEYNERRALPEDDPRFIPSSVSFEDYAAKRTLGLANDTMNVSLSPPPPLFPPASPSPSPSIDASQTPAPPPPAPPPTPQQVYDALSSILGDALPSFDVFQRDASWLHDLLPDVAAPKSGPDFLRALMKTIETEILNPKNFAAHVKAAGEAALVTDFFLQAQKNPPPELTTAHEDAQAHFDALSAIGTALFGTDFARDTAETQLATFDELRREASTLFPEIHFGPMVPPLAESYDDRPLLDDFIHLAQDYGIKPLELNRILDINVGKEKQAANDYLGEPGHHTGKGKDLEAAKKAADRLSPDEGRADELHALLDAALRASAPKRPLANVRGELERVKGTPVRAALRQASSEPPTAFEPITLPELQARIDAKRDALDSQNELDDQRSLRLQMYLDRKTKIASTLSNVLKKQSDTAGLITGNLK